MPDNVTSLQTSGTKRRGRPRSYPPPAWSERIFLEINPHDVHMFRYLLEAYDNLGYMSVVDRWRAVLRVSYSPHQREEITEVLEGMGKTVSFTLLPAPDITVTKEAGPSPAPESLHPDERHQHSGFAVPGAPAKE